MTTATIIRGSIPLGKEPVVVLSLKEYYKLCGQTVPTYYIKGKEAIALDKLVKEGIKEYRAGKCISAPSMTEALKVYAKKEQRKLIIPRSFLSIYRNYRHGLSAKHK